MEPTEGFPRTCPRTLPRNKAAIRASTKEVHERQSAQFRPLGYYCLAVVGTVHALPESWSARVLAGHLVLAALDRSRSESRSRRRYPGTGNPRHLHQRLELPDLCAE